LPYGALPQIAQRSQIRQILRQRIAIMRLQRVVLHHVFQIVDSGVQLTFIELPRPQVSVELRQMMLHGVVPVSLLLILARITTGECCMATNQEPATRNQQRFSYPKRVTKRILLFVFAASAVWAEVHPLTLRQAVEIALRENPDVVLARLDEQKAQAGIGIAKAPFSPKVYAGSGDAKTWGYPGSIEGAAPSIVQTRADMSLFNRPKSFEVARAKENARGAAIGVQSKSEEAAYQTASAFLDTEQMVRSVQSLRLEVESLERVAEATKLRVEEGRELALENKRVAVDLARARQRFESLTGDVDYAQASLAVVLGFPAGDRAQPTDDDRKPLAIPESQQAARDLALENSHEIRRLESELQAKGFELRGYQAARLPVVDLVAQYSLFEKGIYQQYFTHIQRNNGQLGVSVQIPVLIGSAAKGQLSQAETDILQLRAQVNQTRNRIDLDTQKSYQDLKKAEGASEVAKLDLDYAREQVSVLLAQFGEGRIPRQRVDDARLNEQEKWIAFYDAQHTQEKARLSVLHATGTLLASLR
jgi:outer membrane protein